MEQSSGFSESKAHAAKAKNCLVHQSVARDRPENHRLPVPDSDTFSSHNAVHGGNLSVIVTLLTYVKVSGRHRLRFESMTDAVVSSRRVRLLRSGH